MRPSQLDLHYLPSSLRIGCNIFMKFGRYKDVNFVICFLKMFLLRGSDEGSHCIQLERAQNFLNYFQKFKVNSYSLDGTQLCHFHFCLLDKGVNP